MRCTVHGPGLVPLVGLRVVELGRLRVHSQRRGVRVANTPGVLTDATAETAFSLLMACARRIAEGDRLRLDPPDRSPGASTACSAIKRAVMKAVSAALPRGRG